MQQQAEENKRSQQREKAAARKRAKAGPQVASARGKKTPRLGLRSGNGRG